MFFLSLATGSCLICYFSWSCHCGSGPDFGELKVVVALQVVENILMFSPVGWQIASVVSCQSTEETPSCLKLTGPETPPSGRSCDQTQLPTEPEVSI